MIRGIGGKSLEVVRDYAAFQQILYLCDREDGSHPYGSHQAPGMLPGIV